MPANDDQSPRARAAPLSTERVVAETLRLIDAQGIAAASMRSVAERLGVQAMSLYRHVASREELFDAVVERVVDELREDPDLLQGPTDGWRPFLERLARGVRRYAVAHPHAFPLVATRPPAAPWINPPLRSVRWVEALLAALHDEGFTDPQVLFTYRTFNSFLLGHLLLETSAMALRDPKPGDGSFQQGSTAGGTDPVDPTDPVPGALSPARSAEERRSLDAASGAAELLDPSEQAELHRYPTVRRLRSGLTEDHYEEEFDSGLTRLLDRIAEFLMH